jgi:hypothetical protein
MPKEKAVRLECHIKFNGRNQRHVSSARALASVDQKYKTSFIALAIENYMKTHPMGISIDELLAMYRQSDRSYMPKATITETRHNGRSQLPSASPPNRLEAAQEDAEAGGAIDKAMDFYDVS